MGVLTVYQATAPAAICYTINNWRNRILVVYYSLFLFAGGWKNGTNNKNQSLDGPLHLLVVVVVVKAKTDERKRGCPERARFLTAPDMATPSDVPLRRNGLSPPYSAPQITSWVFLVATAIHFLVFISPNLPTQSSVPVTIFFFLIFGTVLYYGLRAIAVDSMDVYLTRSLVDQRNGAIRNESSFLNRCYTIFNGDANALMAQQVPENQETKQCWICDIQVAHHAMHCKYCNKCVSHFDHHCLWLNTCVGAKNYKDFFRVMLSISAMQLFHTGISAWLAVDITLGGPTEGRADEWLGRSGMAVPVAAVLLFFVVFDLISLVLLAQLISFHIHLQKKRITTYQYIVQDGQRRREKAKLQMDLDNQRESELARARDEGLSWYAFRLNAGEKFRQWGCCGCLDPLEMPQPAPEPDPSAGFSVALGGGGGGGGTATTTGTAEQPNLSGVDGDGDVDEDTGEIVMIQNVDSLSSSAAAEENRDETGTTTDGTSAASNHSNSGVAFRPPSSNGL